MRGGTANKMIRMQAESLGTALLEKESFVDKITTQLAQVEAALSVASMRTAVMRSDLDEQDDGAEARGRGSASEGVDAGST